MSWIWLIVALLTGFGAGSYLGFAFAIKKIEPGDDITVRKIKQKNTKDSNQDVTNVLDRIRDRTTWLEKRKAKKALKRENNNH